MGRAYYLENLEQKIEFVYSVNGNCFWKMSIDDMFSKVYLNGWHITTDYRFIPLEEFLCFNMNGVRHVFLEEYLKFEQYSKGKITFPEYDPLQDDKIYTFNPE